MTDARRLPQDPIPLNRVNVYVPRDVAYNIDKMFEVTKSVLGRLGCEGCHSGRLIDFRIIEDFVVNPKTLQVEELQSVGRF
jgi:hypothetical protein